MATAGAGDAQGWRSYACLCPGVPIAQGYRARAAIGSPETEGLHNGESAVSDLKLISGHHAVAVGKVNLLCNELEAILIADEIVARLRQLPDCAAVKPLERAS
jgi:hypothetical protein